MSDTDTIFTEFGLIEAPKFLKTADKSLRCEGDACPDLLMKISGRSVVLRNNSNGTISGKIEWGHAFGCNGYATPYTLFSGEQEGYPFPNSGILGVCKIVASY